jgi:hypothetical protein
LLKQDLRYHPSISGGFLDRGTYAASRILITRDDCGEMALNTSFVAATARFWRTISSRSNRTLRLSLAMAASDWQTSLPSGSLMSGVRKEQLDQAAYKPPGEPFDFAQGRRRYLRRCRNRRYVFISALIIVGMGFGVVAVLLAEWLTPLAR